jgi:dephospho-CoA kinase
VAAHAGVSELAIGLTGGIGCGKTTVAGVFESLGASVIDTDQVARDLTSPGGAAIDAIRREFGASFVTAQGALDRAAMRELVFEDGAARERLESILHPAIREEALRRISRAASPYALVAVPLLFEASGAGTGGFSARVARKLVVDCDERLQVERAAARPGMSAERVRSIMRAQWPRWRRLQCADDVVWNGAGLDALPPQCARLHARYEALAR